MKNFFRKFLPSKPTPPVQTLAQKIESLDDQSQDFLINLVQTTNKSDSESILCLEAIARLTFNSNLVNLAIDEHTSSEIKKAARLRVASMLDDASITLADLSSSVKDHHVLIAITHFCSSDVFHNELIDSVQEPEALSDLCLSNIPVATKQVLAQRITDEKTLKALLKASKSKEKAVYKIVKTKLDALKALEQEQLDAANTIKITLADISHHAKRQADVVYAARLDVLVDRWKALAAYTNPDDNEAFESARKQCIEQISERAKHAGNSQTAAGESQVPAEVASSSENGLALEKPLVAQEGNLGSEDAAECAEIVSEEPIVETLPAEIVVKAHQQLGKYWDIICGVFSSEEMGESAVTEKISVLDDDWTTLFGDLIRDDSLESVRSQLLMSLSTVQAFQAKHSAINSYRLALESVEDIDDALIQGVKFLDKVIRSLSKAVSSCIELPSELSQDMLLTKDAVVSIQQKITQKKQEDEKSVRIIGSLIRKALSNVDRGQLKTAVGMRRSIAHKAEHLLKTPGFIVRQMEDLDAAIAKLIDWQSYAVLPKKEALVESMQQLVGLDVPPDALAVKIKKLQSEWKELQQSGKSEDETLWQKFKAFGDEAYEPCKSYFNDLAIVRQENLVKRQGVIDQLVAFDAGYDWEKADWKVVENVLRTARKEFRDHAPVERAANEPVSTAFDAIADAIFSRVTAERDKNKIAKEQLIVQVKALEDSTDIQQAINGIKRLQAQWKTIGQCHYRDNDALWKSFRQSCDIVFSRKNEQDNAAQQVINTAKAEVNDLIVKVASLEPLALDQPHVAVGELDKLKTAFAEVDSLPENVARAVARDFYTAVEKIESSIADSQQKNKATVWQQVFTLSDAIGRLGLKSPDDRDIATVDIENKLADTRWPEGVKQLLKTKYESMADVTSISEDSLQSSEETLRLLCIRAEILTDHSSPETDSALRMTYQMSLLKDGIRYKRDAETALILTTDWLRVSAVPADVYEALFKRFYACWLTLDL